MSRVAAVLALGVVALLGTIGVNVYRASRTYEVTAYVISAAQVVPGNDVTIGGVPAGRVSDVGLAPDDGGPAGARITMQIDPRYAPLRAGTRVTIRPKALLGSMLVDLAPGSGGGTIPSGGTIPVQDTAVPVTLDEVTDLLDPRARQSLQTLTRQGGVALQGRGQDVNRVLQQLPQVSSDLAATAGALDERDQELDALTVEFDRVAGMVAGEDSSLRGDLRDGADLLDVLAQHQQQLQDELVSADGSLAELNAGLGGHEAALSQVLKQQPELLDELRQFEAGSTTTFGVIDPCIGDVLAAIGEIQSATAYPHPGGSVDGAGFMLRTDPQLVGASTGTFTPSAPCAGAGATAP
jgi:phospholipid/cholesterol/gamma-HCH transport system substrate-binding protein